jgi:hypothetical protein
LGIRPALLFSHGFDGVVWNMQVAEKAGMLIIEVRNAEKKHVSFAALDLSTNRFLWENVQFDEPWWINLSAVRGDVILLTHYTEAANPDQKSLLAYSISGRKLLWWQNDFSLVSVNDIAVAGYSQKYGVKPLVLDIFTGKVINGDTLESPAQNLSVIRPLHYREGESGFETVKKYLMRIGEKELISGVDYLEHAGFVVLSVYVQEDGLANFLIVLDQEGTMVLREKAGGNLKGIGIDTFFILEGSLFFVKNKRELLRYKLIDKTVGIDRCIFSSASGREGFYRGGDD